MRFRLGRATGEKADRAANSKGANERARAPQLMKDRDDTFHTLPADSGKTAWFADCPGQAMGYMPHIPPVPPDRAP